jgi:hypothetical protein
VKEGGDRRKRVREGRREVSEGRREVREAAIGGKYG